ncbi:hypothetical protein [Psychromicrobium lacuslunae]|uniref:Gram-positive cocci surface proteins LPxTG domain-containing protein n=1 Tax=Psychromicrobium lacuslunae TaxID=1618207 RepID=A0A0D4C2B9_9MICC|nr:hypothetical protein [Psychromicrobium lacuslunae]AJT42530.1 hypothetical protein UM93_15425 [Psychromicrobium lacuslunae]
MIGLVIALCCLLLPIGQASAISTGWRLGAGLGSAALWVGQQRNAEGLLVYCTDYEKHSPGVNESYVAVKEGSFVRSDGVRLSPQQNSALSYLLLRWGRTHDNLTAAAVQLSIWALTSPGRSWHSPGMSQIIAKGSLPAAAVSLGLSLTEQSLRFAGPYRIAMAMSRPGAASVSILGASGASVPGLAVRLKSSGTLSVAGKDQLWTSTATAHMVPVQRTGFGAGSLQVAVDQAPAAALQWLVPKSKTTQRLISSEVTSPVQATLKVQALSMKPVVHTETSAKVLSGTAELNDTLTVSLAAGPAGGQTWLIDPQSNKPVELRVISMLWGPLNARPRESTVVPSGTPLLGTVSTAVRGPGRFSTPALTISKPGYYVWTERINPSSAIPASAHDSIRPWQGSFGLPAETSLSRWRPAISTELSSHQGEPGIAISDQLHLSGSIPAGQTVRLTMYGPLAERPLPASQVPAGSKIFKSVELPLSGPMKADFGILPLPGCYTVVATVAGSTEVVPFRGIFGDPQETVCLKRASAPMPQPPHPGPVAAPSTAPTKPAPATTASPPSQSSSQPNQGVAKLANTGNAGLLAVSGGAGLLTLAGCTVLLLSKLRLRRNRFLRQ